MSNESMKVYTSVVNWVEIFASSICQLIVSCRLSSQGISPLTVVSMGYFYWTPLGKWAVAMGGSSRTSRMLCSMCGGALAWYAFAMPLELLTCMHRRICFVVYSTSAQSHTYPSPSAFAWGTTCTRSSGKRESSVRQSVFARI